MNLRRAIKSPRDAVIVGLVLIALHQAGGAWLIKAKAWLAPLLIDNAWDQTMAAAGAPVKPWPWADTWPISRLEIPELGLSLPILAGDSGNVLAFAPGHASWSARPGSPGLSVIGGHRDTHFEFMRELRAGAVLRVQLVSGEWRDYIASAGRVVDVRHERPRPDPDNDRLQLVTCYPFDAIRAGGPLRYVIDALPLSGQPGPYHL